MILEFLKGDESDGEWINGSMDASADYGEKPKKTVMMTRSMIVVFVSDIEFSKFDGSLW